MLIFRYSRFIGEVSQHLFEPFPGQKKSPLLQNFIAWGQILALVWLCVPVILVQIMIHSHSFHVNEADNRILRTPISLKMHKKCPKQEKKMK